MDICKRLFVPSQQSGDGQGICLRSSRLRAKTLARYFLRLAFWTIFIVRLRILNSSTFLPLLCLAGSNGSYSKNSRYCRGVVSEVENFSLDGEEYASTYPQIWQQPLTKLLSDEHSLHVASFCTLQALPRKVAPVEVFVLPLVEKLPLSFGSSSLSGLAESCLKTSRGSQKEVHWLRWLSGARCWPANDRTHTEAHFVRAAPSQVFSSRFSTRRDGTVRGHNRAASSVCCMCIWITKKHNIHTCDPHCARSCLLASPVRSTARVPQPVGQCAQSCEMTLPLV